MKVFRFDGKTVYQLETLWDLALVPEDVFERNGGWQMIEMSINMLRLELALSRDPEAMGKAISMAPCQLTDDGDLSFHQPGLITEIRPEE